MAQAGCQLFEQTSSRAAMAYNAFVHVAHYCGLIKRIRTYLKTNPVDLVIVCDSPAFNFHIARAARRLGVPTLFYVAPQLWAWAPWRIRKLRKYCDRLCCILPFEQEWFGSRGLDAAFVGNPLLDDLAQADLTAAKKRYENFDPNHANVALLPGSRQAELRTLWRPMQQIAVELRRKYRNISFTTVAVDEETRAVLNSSQMLGFHCTYDVGSVYETARNCDFAIVASGSATLQVAAAGCPMVIMYQSSRLLWHLVGRWLVRTKHLSLVNILAARPLVPEFMPYFTSIDPIAETIESQLADPENLRRISAELLDVVEPLTEKNTATEVAQIALAMLADKQKG